MRCSKAFFGRDEIPVIDINQETLEELARQNSNLGLTVPGVQKKISLHLSDQDSPRLTLVGYPAGYILKPQTEEYRQLPEAEDLVMDIADLMGVRTVAHGLIDLNGEYAYITRRVDRAGGQVFAMEDFCQLSERLTQDKYKGSYERCAGIIMRHSSVPGFDLSEFFLRLLVCFLTGNSDMHLKNFSLIERTPGGRDFVLSPAYDLLPVNVILPEDTEEAALTLNGKKSNLTRNDFLALANNIKLSEKAAKNMMALVASKVDGAIDLCHHSYLDQDLKDTLIDLMRKRAERILP